MRFKTVWNSLKPSKNGPKWTKNWSFFVCFYSLITCDFNHCVINMIRNNHYIVKYYLVITIINVSIIFWSFVRIIKFSRFTDFFYFSVFKSQLHKNWWSDIPKNSFLNQLIPLDSISNLKFHFENSTSKHIFDVGHHPKNYA